MSASLFLVNLSAVFFVVDPIGVVPIFLAMTGGDSAAKMHTMAMRACLVGGALLIFFALFGSFVFRMMGVSLSAFRVAGGLLLLMTALDMMRARRSETRNTPGETAEGAHKEDIAIVPLAVPLLAGPGSIATVMVLMTNSHSMLTTASILLGILLTFIASYFVLRGAVYVQRVLKESGVAILQRVMGLILASIAVQFMAEGGKALLGR
jgi:multiple antibiotic resistance protein